jgi:hypothetical protein
MASNETTIWQVMTNNHMASNETIIWQSNEKQLYGKVMKNNYMAGNETFIRQVYDINSCSCLTVK